MCPKSIFAVYDPSLMKFGMKVGHRTLITGKILRSRYLGYCYHGNQKTSTELTKHPKGCGILSGGTLDGRRVVAMDFCYHGNHYVVMMYFSKSIRWQFRNMLDVTMTSLVTRVTSSDTVTSHWPSMTRHGPRIWCHSTRRHYPGQQWHHSNQESPYYTQLQKKVYTLSFGG